MNPTMSVMSDTKFVYPASRKGKKFKVDAKKILDNVLVLSFGSQAGFVLDKKKKSDKFPSDAVDIAISAFLVPDYNASTGQCAIGIDDSDDPSDYDEAASLTITFSNTPPNGPYGLPYEGELDTLWIAYLENNPEAYLDLKSLAGNNRYCQIQVNTVPYAPETAMIEKNVIIHISDTSGEPYLIYANDDSSQQNTNLGSTLDSVVNSNIYFDLNDFNELYLFTLIVFEQAKKNEVTFSIGDPRTDAVVSVDEV